MQSGDESEEKESQLYGSTSARDMSSLAGTSITRDSWDTRDTSITRDSWDTRDTKDTRDSWDTNLSSKDTWDPKIRLKDTWQNSKSSRDSWELSTSTRDSLEPRTSVYRNPLQVACSIPTDSIHFFDMLTLRIPQENPGVSGVYISADPGFAEILPGEVRAKEIVVKTCEYILSANSNISTEATQPDST